MAPSLGSHRPPSVPIHSFTGQYLVELDYLTIDIKQRSEISCHMGKRKEKKKGKNKKNQYLMQRLRQYVT